MDFDLKKLKKDDFFWVNFKRDKKYNYFFVQVAGNYFDSDFSPIRIKDGDKLVVHEIPTLDDMEITASVGKTVCLLLNDGMFIVSKAVLYMSAPVYSSTDGRRILLVRSFNPDECMYVSFEKILRMFVADTMFSR